LDTGGLLVSLSSNVRGIMVGIAIAVALVLLLQWLLWMFGWGRFAPTGLGPAGATRETTVRYILVRLLTEIINDFRPLLALFIVFVFAVTLFIVVYAGWASFDVVKDGVQLVVASLGGLVGSIIGYYFGESAAERRYSAPAEAIPPAPAPEQQPGQGGGGVRPARQPPTRTGNPDEPRGD
jgi:hypothetical protein